MKVDRREYLERFTTFVAGSPLTQSQRGGGAPPNDRLAPVLELVNVPEFESMAKLVLSPERYDSISGGHHRSFDKMTLRQRLMVYAMDLDLTTTLFGYEMFTPILVGPVSDQTHLHSDGQLGTARGASAAKAIMVATNDSDHPVDELIAASDEPVWYQVYADSDTAHDEASRSVAAGCQAVCVTIGVSSSHSPVATDWSVVERVIQEVDVPVVVKGIMNSSDAQAAVDRGAQGVVISNHGGLAGGEGALPIDVLPAVADVLTEQVPIIVDGSFRRGTDVLKGLALGATAVMVARPPMWGLAAYGAEGVQTVVEILQTELARNMAASGRPTIAMIARDLVRFDSK